MALSYSQSLEAGTTASASEVQAMFNDVKTYVDTLGTGTTDTTYRTIKALPLVFYASNSTGAGAAANLFARVGDWIPSGTSSSGGVSGFYFDDADVTLTGETPVMRLRAQLFTNATAPAMTFTVGLHEITATAGTANAVTTTMNSTPVSGSTVAFASPSASTRYQNTSTAFTVPADGYYVFGMVTSAALATNSAVQVGAQLQVRVAD